MFSSAEIKEHLHINVRPEDGECAGGEFLLSPASFTLPNLESTFLKPGS